MKTFATILALAGATAAMAGCPNMCSGKGDCTADDVCQCWAGYTGYDCSQRECPMVESWALNSREGAHYYSECAGAGICDRSTGTCQCFPGYEGRGCERSACPNGCSGRGTCRMIADLPNVVEGDAAGSTIATGSGLTGLAWDQKALTACVCDGGYMGPDCSQRVCPFGDDPMTVCEQGNVEQKQQFELQIPGDFSSVVTASNYQEPTLQNADAFALRFTSYAGEEFYTSAFDINPGVAEGASISGVDIQNTVGSNLAAFRTNLAGALEGIPNFRLKSVNVDSVADNNVDTAQGAGHVTFHPVITFQHDAEGNSYGAQNLLKCPHRRTIRVAQTAGSLPAVYTYGCGEAGCQPKIPQMRAVTAVEADADGTAAFSASTVAFTADSVLTCGVNPDGSYQLCDGGGAATYNGGLNIIFKSGLLYAQHVVGGAIGTVEDVSGGSSALNSFDFDGAAEFPTVGGTNYHFLGQYLDIHTNHVVDMSAVMPGVSVDFGSAPAGNKVFRLFYTPAQCEDAVDVTRGGTIASNPQPFDNYDVENVECSARGECDRTTGQCQCFHGYTGLNCGMQTILV